ncbi:MAG: glucosyltransferase domain-containing protein [Acetatifactor muris]|nr:glucosyltransferase domain-containing protein [Acetatifactor muris]
MELWREIKDFLRCKPYIIILSLTAACAYGFAIVHPAIGIDETAVSLYYDDGLTLSFVNRWSLFIVNKVFRIGTFMPWMVDLVSILIFMLSVTLWCIFWRKICGSVVELPLWSYAFAAGIFISCPLIAEIYTLYLHNGICMGYGVTACALLCLLKSLERKTARRHCIMWLVISSVLLTFALGLYESFIVVFVLGGAAAFSCFADCTGKRPKPPAITRECCSGCATAF